jgi:hypothetical protein
MSATRSVPPSFFNSFGSSAPQNLETGVPKEPAWQKPKADGKTSALSEYRLFSGHNRTHIETVVTKALKAGWIAQGGCLIYEPDDKNQLPRFIQAMVR